MLGGVTEGELPKGWARALLEDVVEIHDDLRKPVNSEEREKRQGPYPYYGATGQVGWIDDFLMDGEFILLGEDGAPFFDSNKPKAYRVDGKCWVNNHAHVLRGIVDVFDNRYLLHSLNHTDYRGFANGTTRLKLTQGAMRRIPLLLPPLGEQRRIVAKVEELFSDLDAGVAALERVRANLKRYRASVLRAAVEGRLTADWRAAHPDAEPASALLARVLADRRAKWEADQRAKFAAANKPPPKNWQDKYAEPAAPDTASLPGLPKGWVWANVEQLGTVQLGRQRSPQNRSNRYPTKYIRAANITESGLALDDLLDMEFEPHELEAYRLSDGDLVLSEASGSPDQVGKPAMWAGAVPDCCFQNTVIRHRPVAGLNSYLLTAYQHSYTNKVFARVAAGVGINHLSAAKFSRIPIPVPPLAEQERIVSEVEERLSVASAAERVVEANLARAGRLRQSILKRAFAGALVPQDPTDEPASALLARLRASREVAAPKKTKKPRGDDGAGHEAKDPGVPPRS